MSGEANSPPALMRKYAIVKSSHREASLAPDSPRVIHATLLGAPEEHMQAIRDRVLLCMFFLVECGMDGRW